MKKRRLWVVTCYVLGEARIQIQVLCLHRLCPYQFTLIFPTSQTHSTPEVMYMSYVSKSIRMYPSTRTNQTFMWAKFLFSNFSESVQAEFLLVMRRSTEVRGGGKICQTYTIPRDLLKQESKVLNKPL